MFLQKRVINGITYQYVEHSFRLGNVVKKVSFILTKDQGSHHERIVRSIALARADYFMKHSQPYFSLPELIEIETEKVFFQIFYPLLDEKSKQEVLAEFVRIFLANSMELEGSTITPQLAESLDRHKKISLPEKGNLEADVIPKMKLKAFRHEGFWLQINTAKDIEEAERFLKDFKF